MQKLNRKSTSDIITNMSIYAHVHYTLTINSCNATSDVLEQEECITKLLQAALIFWYKYQKIDLILIIQ